ncbi:acetyl-CoA C-acyltransferase [Sinisalibacter lacisalsi]|uniref:Acetyl-CoA acetyltransferase n=1 Tax=Sinisalibacter lacisalsi TaxID=1526570 RepID=A0ABQ1QAX0_9RHOB|nr:acetyl-CoA C-acyltransferase [Sinisalibacter lacisalsi]GGD20142.1 acetyl-CoA acetyltransferase [Sinisalibacter lacisalsi]
MARGEIVIAGSARTPMGSFQGGLTGMSASELGARAIRAALQDAGARPGDVRDLIMGNVLMAGQGQAPARQAGFGAGLGADVPATTVNKMCGSGMKTAMMAHDALALGADGVIVAGGMESMTQAPYLLPRMRAGQRIGHGAVLDHMFTDGLEDAYEEGRLMGSFAEDCAAAEGLSRETQDDYARTSLERARAAQAAGAFDAEIAPVTVPTRGGEHIVSADEQPGRANPDKIANLRPAFREGGTVTAANSSSISDGAAALVMCSQETARALGLNIRARVVAHASHAQAPAEFLTAPIGAAHKLLDRAGWTAAQVDLWEVNEAFAIVPLLFMRALGVSHDRLNIHGGACALGHPVGASGARIMVTLLHAMERQGARRGVAAICIGGGEATAMAVERV